MGPSTKWTTPSFTDVGKKSSGRWGSTHFKLHRGLIIWTRKNRQSGTEYQIKVFKKAQRGRAQQENSGRGLISLLIGAGGSAGNSGKKGRH